MRANFKILRFLALAVGVCLLSGMTQQRDPIAIEGLLKSVSRKALSSKELVEQVERRGVAFQLTQTNEQKIRRAGKYLGKKGLDDLVAAVRGNYRGAASAPIPERFSLPKLDFVYEQKPPYLSVRPYPTEKITGQEYEVNIGVKNNSAEIINDVRVEVERVAFGARLERILEVPLRLLNDNPPYKQSFPLQPGEELYLRVLKFNNLEPGFLLYIATLENPMMLEQGVEFVLILRGANVPSRKGRLSVLPWRGGSYAVTFRSFGG